MNIEPTYVTFQQAKLLREKGFNVECKALINSSYEPHHLKILEGQFLQKNSELLSNCYSAPEQWMVIEWLRVRYGIWINVVRTKFTVACRYQSYIEEKPLTGSMGGFISHISPQEAYNAAIDYVLNNLI